MQQLSVSRINAIAPYSVWYDNSSYIFTTDYGVRIGVNFDEDNDILDNVTVYWFNIVNLNGKPSPKDHKMMPTIWAIIEEFFRLNPEVLLYLCDTANNQQAMRARLFRYWFNSYKGKDKYIFEQAEIPDEGVVNYVALIVKHSNPNAESICKEFQAQAELFKTNK